MTFFGRPSITVEAVQAVLQALKKLLSECLSSRHFLLPSHLVFVLLFGVLFFGFYFWVLFLRLGVFVFGFGFWCLVSVFGLGFGF